MRQEPSKPAEIFPPPLSQLDLTTWSNPALLDEYGRTCQQRSPESPAARLLWHEIMERMIRTGPVG